MSFFLRQLMNSLGTFFRTIRAFFSRQITGVSGKFRQLTNFSRNATKAATATVQGAAAAMKKPSERGDYIETQRLFISKSFLVLVAVGIVAVVLLFIFVIWPFLLSHFFTAHFWQEDKRVADWSGRVVVYYDEDKKVPMYSGRLEDGVLQGEGKEYDQDGLLTYEGPFVDGLRSGKGLCYEAGVLVYDGQLLAGVYQGTGRLYQDGELAYEGGFADGKASGTGTAYANGAVRYQGNFQDGLYQGSGETYYPSGAVEYRGSFAQGEYEGEGSYYREEGSLLYKGGFSAGLYEGAGTVYLEGGDRIQADFSAGEAAGAIQWYRGGRLWYEGESDDLTPDGFGTVYAKSGKAVYAGEMDRGTLDGAWLLTLTAEDLRAAFGEASVTETDGSDGFLIYNKDLGLTALCNYQQGEEAPQVYRLWLAPEAGTPGEGLLPWQDLDEAGAWAQLDREETPTTSVEQGAILQPDGVAGGNWVQSWYGYGSYTCTLLSRDGTGAPVQILWRRGGEMPAGAAESVDPALDEAREKLDALLEVLDALGENGGPVGGAGGGAGSGGGTGSGAGSGTGSGAGGTGSDSGTGTGADGSGSGSGTGSGADGSGSGGGTGSGADGSGSGSGIGSGADGSGAGSGTGSGSGGSGSGSGTGSGAGGTGSGSGTGSGAGGTGSGSGTGSGADGSGSDSGTGSGADGSGSGSGTGSGSDGSGSGSGTGSGAGGTGSDSGTGSGSGAGTGGSDTETGGSESDDSGSGAGAGTGGGAGSTGSGSGSGSTGSGGRPGSAGGGVAANVPSLLRAVDTPKDAYDLMNAMIDYYVYDQALTALEAARPLDEETLREQTDLLGRGQTTQEAVDAVQDQLDARDRQIYQYQVLRKEAEYTAKSLTGQDLAGLDLSGVLRLEDASGIDAAALYADAESYALSVAADQAEVDTAQLSLDIKRQVLDLSVAYENVEAARQTLNRTRAALDRAIQSYVKGSLERSALYDAQGAVSDAAAAMIQTAGAYTSQFNRLNYLSGGWVAQNYGWYAAPFQELRDGAIRAAQADAQDRKQKEDAAQEAARRQEERVQNLEDAVEDLKGAAQPQESGEAAA